jgi:hydrogenase-4 component B
MAAGTRQIETFGGLLRVMPWTGLFFLIGAAAISGLPPLNGFASEWLTFQAFLYGSVASAEPLVDLLYPLGGALLALTSALAAACFVKAFGMVFLALPRSRDAAEARESPALMLGPQAFLALLCLALGIFPGLVLRNLQGVLASIPGVSAPAGLVQNELAIASGLAAFDRVVPIGLALTLAGGVGLAALVTRRAVRAVRRAPTWGCGGVLTARNEYTATAFSKPLMMVFSAIYRPTREVEGVSRVSPYFLDEVRYRAEIEPTFERYFYAPLARAVIGVARGLRRVQAGSLHAYLGYVIVLVVSLVILVWWRG